MSLYLTETQLTHLSFRLRNLLLFTTVSMFSCCSKGGRAIADRDFFYLRTRSQHPSLFTLKYLTTEISFAAVSRHFIFPWILVPKLRARRSQHAPKLCYSLFQGQFRNNDNRYFGVEIMLQQKNGGKYS